MVRTSEGSFNSIAGDMKLEQSIQCLSKSSKGIIGQTRSLDYTTEWCSIYHEILGIKNAFKSLINPNDASSETHVHHELSKSVINHFNVATRKVKEFMEERGNPYLLGDSTKKLKNISSQVVSQAEVSIKHLNFFELSRLKFDEFRNKVYVERSGLLSDVIHQFQLLPVDHVTEVKRNDVKQSVNSIKQLRYTKKIFSVVSERFKSNRKAIKYDINPYNPLFDGSTMAPTPGKSDMATEVEAFLKEEHLLEQICASNVIIDFMSFSRSQNISTTRYPNFKVLIDSLYHQIFEHASEKTVHIVFDSYEEKSLKEATRQLRSSHSLNICKIQGNTPLPHQMEKFWSSSKNKESFQIYVREEFTSMAQEKRQHLILSGMLINGIQVPAIHISAMGEKRLIDQLICNIEEADQRLIKHIFWSVKKEKKTTFIVRSKDTDVMMLLINYVNKFIKAGMRKLWQEVGVGDNKRYVPVHHMYDRIPKPLIREVLLACYIGTGCDYLSKVGTKLSALSALPENFLKRFGKVELDTEQISLAEEYLVNVLKKNAAEKTFDELRLNQYEKQLDILDLPPTSHSITKGHIPRWWFLTKKLNSLLGDCEFSLDPTQYGWEDKDGHLLPEKNLLPVPDNILETCNCKHVNAEKRCQSQRCSCKKTGIHCTSFCECKTICRNKI